MLASRAAAHAFGLPYVEAIDWHPGLLVAWASQAGIPAIEPEIGGQGVALTERSALYERGTRNLLCHLGILAGQPEAPFPPRELTGRAAGLVVAPVGGILARHVEAGALVTASQSLAAIVDLHGEHLAGIVAPQDGVVVGIRTRAMVEPGDAVALVMALAGS
jgi:predicted deacylase